MGKRREARELALKFLYQSEFNSDGPDSELSPFFERANVSEEIQGFTQVLIEKLLFHFGNSGSLIQNSCGPFTSPRLIQLSLQI